MSAWKPEEGQLIRLAPPPKHRLLRKDEFGVWEMENVRTGEVYKLHEDSLMQIHEPDDEIAEAAPAVPLELRRIALDYALAQSHELSAPENVIDAANAYLQFLLDG